MLLPASSELVPSLVLLPSIASTNAELVRRAARDDLPAFTTVVTDDQTDGRGRLDRSWVAPRGTSLAVSVLLRPINSEGSRISVSHLGWLPIAAGVAMTDAIEAVLFASVVPEASVGFKWPNDVQVNGRKICGVLAELLPAGDGVVMGAGVNLTQRADQLPVPTATSAALEGADEEDLPDRVLSVYLRRLIELVVAFVAEDGDADRSGLREAAVVRCTTLGRPVRAELPGGRELVGEAVGMDTLGRLQLRAGSGRVETIAAGDIVHLR